MLIWANKEHDSLMEVFLLWNGGDPNQANARLNEFKAEMALVAKADVDNTQGKILDTRYIEVYTHG